MAHRSRWGWHPCDYTTYLLLKQLHGLCERARRRFAAWQRWHRKMPHNRVIRCKVLDGSGRKIGAEVVGSQPEPPLAARFCVRRQVLTYWSEEARPLREGRLIEEVVFDDLGIPAAYRAARTPAPTEEQVAPLPFTPEEVRRLLEGATDNG